MTYVLCETSFLSSLDADGLDLVFDLLNANRARPKDFPLKSQPSKADPELMVYILDYGPGGTCLIEVDAEKGTAALLPHDDGQAHV